MMKRLIFETDTIEVSLEHVGEPALPPAYSGTVRLIGYTGAIEATSEAVHSDETGLTFHIRDYRPLPPLDGWEAIRQLLVSLPYLTGYRENGRPVADEGVFDWLYRNLPLGWLAEGEEIAA